MILTQKGSPFGKRDKTPRATFPLISAFCELVVVGNGGGGRGGRELSAIISFKILNDFENISKGLEATFISEDLVLRSYLVTDLFQHHSTGALH